MAKTRLNSLPEFKAPPPPPLVEKQKAPDDVVADVLDLLRPYTPQQQNFIIGETLKETTYIRHQEMMLQRDKLTQAEGNFKEFLDLQRVGEEVWKQIDKK